MLRTSARVAGSSGGIETACEIVGDSGRWREMAGGGGAEVVGDGGRWREVVGDGELWWEMTGYTCFAPMTDTLRVSDLWETVTVFWPIRIVEDPSALGSGTRTAPPYRLPSCSVMASSVTWEMMGDGGK